MPPPGIVVTAPLHFVTEPNNMLGQVNHCAAIASLVCSPSILRPAARCNRLHLRLIPPRPQVITLLKSDSPSSVAMAGTCKTRALGTAPPPPLPRALSPRVSGTYYSPKASWDSHVAAAAAADTGSHPPVPSPHHLHVAPPRAPSHPTLVCLGVIRSVPASSDNKLQNYTP